MTIEYRGSRQQCIDFLKKLKFSVSSVGWAKRGWLAAIEYEKPGDFIGEVATWDSDKAHFVAYAWRLPPEKRRDPSRKRRSEETYEDRLDDLGESPDY